MVVEDSHAVQNENKDVKAEDWVASIGYTEVDDA